MNDAVAVTFVSSHARLGSEENYLLRLIDAPGPPWERHVICLEDAPFVGGSRAVTETFRGRWRHKVDVVHNGLPELTVDGDQGRGKLVSALGEGAEDVVSLVARVDPTKGHRELIAVLPELLARRPGLRVAFIGDEHFPHLEFAQELRRELAARGLEDAVVFLGFRADALELIAGSDLVVIPSTVEKRGLGREGFPYVGLEAM